MAIKAQYTTGFAVHCWGSLSGLWNIIEVDLNLAELNTVSALLLVISTIFLAWNIYLLRILRRRKLEQKNSSNLFRQDLQSLQEALTELLVEFENRLQQRLDLDQAMSSSLRSSEDAETNIIELNDSRKEIEELLSVIADIGVQTRVLALNASIEAERAGAAGKGFAVVASEVNELSQESKRSLELIEQGLGSLQTGIGRALTSISKATYSLKSFELDTHHSDFKLKIDNLRKQLESLGSSLS